MKNFIHRQGGITETIYNQKAKTLREELLTVGVEKTMHNGADEKFAITITYLLSVASRSVELFKSSKVAQKRALINFVLSNPSLNRGKVQYKLKKPFDIIERLSICK